jgi:hypothetical protein
MGHKRLGDLPNTGGWKRFKQLLANAGTGTDAAAEAALQALSKRLPSLNDDPGLAQGFWLLVQVIWPSRRSDYFDILKKIGIELGPTETLSSPAAFIAKVVSFAQRSLDADASATVFSNIANLAFRETLTRALGERIPTLLEGNAQDIQSACQQLATSKQFGRLGRNFFASYLTRLLQYFIEREVPNHVGPGRRFANPAELTQFRGRVAQICQSHTQVLEAHFAERAAIVESFSGSYASLHTYKRDLGLESIRNRFIPIAIEKLQAEMSVAHGAATAGVEADI